MADLTVNDSAVTIATEVNSLNNLNNIVETCDAKIDISNSDDWPNGVYRPRGALARALYHKQISDRRLQNIDRDKWYQCDLTTIPHDLAQRFHQLHADAETVEFLDHAEEQAGWILTQIWHIIAKTFLGIFMTQTSINGMLGRGSMFVVSKSQFLQMIDVPTTTTERIGGSLLDLGAGDGAVTRRLSSLYDMTYATEISTPMRKILQKSGFSFVKLFVSGEAFMEAGEAMLPFLYGLLDIDNWHEDKKFNTILCLNLLDRCDRPIEILKKIKSSLTAEGFVLVALVLPFSAYVESGTKDHKPTEQLQISGATFEEQVTSFWMNVLEPLDFELETWSRVPYLCEGDLSQSYYFLDDALFILKNKYVV